MASVTTAATENKKLRLAIVGGGIGGLTFAAALKGCTNIEVDLYEQAHQISEIGAGITIWPRTWDILKSLGLENELVSLLGQEPSKEPGLSFEFRLGDRKNASSFLKLYARGGALCFHRQEIQGVLLRNVPDFCKIHLLHHLTRCEEGEDSVKLFFQDGSEASCDILVAADGIKSVARNTIPNEGIFYTGTDVYRGLVPKETLAKLYPGHRVLRDPVIYCGKNKHIVVYPISRGRIINVVAFDSHLENEGKLFEGPGIASITTEEVLERFSGWEDEVQQLLGSIENPSRWVLRDLHSMDTYVSRRIALLGDAAHAMTPHLGAGAGQAIEDGYVLGRLFGQSGPENWDRVLEAYNLVRQPFGNMVRNNARSNGFYYTLNAPEFKNIEAEGQDLTPDQVEALRKAITKNYSWYEDDAGKDLTRAVAFLKADKDY